MSILKKTIILLRVFLAVKKHERLMKKHNIKHPHSTIVWGGEYIGKVKK